MSGGGNNGAWEAGVMWGLANFGNPEDYYWDVVTGISAGAINTAGTVMFAKEDIFNMTQFMSDQWNGLTSADVWTKNGEGIFNEKSLYDTAPAMQTLQNIMAQGDG